MEALLDRCLEQVSTCATVPRPVFTCWTSDSAYFDRLNRRFECKLIIYRACVVGGKNERRFLTQFVDISTGVKGSEFSIEAISMLVS